MRHTADVSLLITPKDFLSVRLDAVTQTQFAMKILGALSKRLDAIKTNALAYLMALKEILTLTRSAWISAMLSV